MTLQRYAVFLYLQNQYLSTSKSCIKMGIPSLNSAILYIISLYFHCHLERASYCHFFHYRSSGKPITSERSESRNLNHANITNIPDLIHENTPFYGQGTHFPVPIHKNRHFYGQQKAVSKIGIQLLSMNSLRGIRSSGRM